MTTKEQDKITKEQVKEAQKEWGKGVVEIGRLRFDRDGSGDDWEKYNNCKKYTSDFIDQFYAFDIGKVLFKPTKCAHKQFRPTKRGAMSYFIAGDKLAYPEDKGFALNPWTSVRFENVNDPILEKERAICMGNYYFMDLYGEETKVEYTFGYRLINGQLKIDLHHSSFPYNP